MQNKKIILAGGSGFIGQQMVRHFGRENEVIVLSRQVKKPVNNRNHYDLLAGEKNELARTVHWDGKDPGEWVSELDSADLLINLAGRSVNCRYTAKNRKDIFDSRTNAVKAIGHAIRRCKVPPKLWINASSATIYRHATDRPQDEYTGEFHDGFSVQVCRLWEKTFYEQELPGTRKIALRMAITLGPGGILIPYFNLLKFKLGGRQGSGKQMFSWVHIEDTCRLIEWMSEKEGMQGTYNCCSPHPVTNSEFMRALRKVTGHRIGIPAWTWMLKPGAPLTGTETELVLKSRWVLPAKALESGFVFHHPLVEDALREVTANVPRKQYHFF